MTKIWLNGALHEAQTACIEASDRGLTLGDGVFDTCACIHGKPFYAEQHLNRLLEQCKALSIPCPADVDGLKKAMHELILANGMGAQALAAIRTTVTRGTGHARGLLPAPDGGGKPTILMTIAPSSAPDTPARMTVSTIRRNEGSPASRLKTLNYLDNILARVNAAENGFDDCLMLNNQDYVCCASAANIFFVKGNVVYTPPLEDGVLGGITRQIIIQLAQTNQLSIQETSIPVTHLSQYDEAFMTNSLVGIRAIREIDTISFDKNDVTTRLQKAYKNMLSK